MEQQQEGRVIRLGCHTYTMHSSANQEWSKQRSSFLPSFSPADYRSILKELPAKLFSPRKKSERLH